MESMTIFFVIIGVCLLFFLFASSRVNMGKFKLESQRALNDNLQKCIDHGMKQSELIMQVGQPTAREVVEDGEIWIYDVVDRGDTTTKGYVGGPVFSATTSTPMEKSTYTLRFDKRGVMVAAVTDGPARGRFRFLHVS